ncbi:hydroxyethylthiazole kinase [Belliella marina]|uniref:Hydroxyethylthiazole kinase n=1 Tax=Belliella marina TaxID=1644146 RepID=A0ABW4VP31_9BACT
MKESISHCFETLKEKSPLVQSITNFVVMNNTANALLSLGASPIMAHAKSEVLDMVGIVNALVINIGTLDEYWVESMLLAAQRANDLGKPWVLDPVGAGATPYRNETIGKLLALKPSVIRGNASEILSLAQVNIKSRGVDSIHDSGEAVQAAINLSKEVGCIVCVSGAKDFIVGGERVVSLDNGHPMMAKVTGMGCTASAIVGAFSGVEKDLFLATTAAMAVLGVAGEIAAEKSDGPGTLQLHLYDTLYNLTSGELMKRMKVEF